MTPSLESAPDSLALLRLIASPAVDGVPGALDPAQVGPEQMGPLMLAGMVEIGVEPPMNDPGLAEGRVPLTHKYVWVKPTDAGRALLAAQEQASPAQ